MATHSHTATHSHAFTAAPPHRQRAGFALRLWRSARNRFLLLVIVLAVVLWGIVAALMKK